jgi:hypothetical protein
VGKGNCAKYNKGDFDEHVTTCQVSAARPPGRLSHQITITRGLADETRNEDLADLTLVMIG